MHLVTVLSLITAVASTDIQGTNVLKEYCPINGRFTYIYDVNDGLENNKECPSSISELDDCPLSSELNLRFRECSFANHDISFKCLGHWSGPSNQNYLALLDTRGDRQPQYRCAMFREDMGSGNIMLAFSSDSTCTSGLHSATVGYETLVLSRSPVPALPASMETYTCRFPSWSQGPWQHIYIEGNSLKYRDHSTFTTYTMRCVDSNISTEERFPVFGHTQCGEAVYTCIWMKRRGMNVFEFQMGLQRSTVYNSSLCADENFLDKHWLTQGRLERLQESPCPIAGEYAGYIPDAVGLCAKLSSDCRSPEIMFYSVSDCSAKEVYEGNRRRGRNRRQFDGKTYYSTITSSKSTTMSPVIEVTQYHTSNPNPGTAVSHNEGKISNIYPGSYYSSSNSYRSSTNRYYNSNEHYESTFTRNNIPTFHTNLNTQDTTMFQEQTEEYDPWTFSKTHQHDSDIGRRTQIQKPWREETFPSYSHQSDERIGDRYRYNQFQYYNRNYNSQQFNTPHVGTSWNNYDVSRYTNDKLYKNYFPLGNNENNYNRPSTAWNIERDNASIIPTSNSSFQVTKVRSEPNRNYYSSFTQKSTSSHTFPNSQNYKTYEQSSNNYNTQYFRLSKSSNFRNNDYFGFHSTSPYDLTSNRYTTTIPSTQMPAFVNSYRNNVRHLSPFINNTQVEPLVYLRNSSMNNSGYNFNQRYSTNTYDNAYRIKSERNPTMFPSSVPQNFGNNNLPSLGGPVSSSSNIISINSQHNAPAFSNNLQPKQVQYSAPTSQRQLLQFQPFPPLQPPSPLTLSQISSGPAFKQEERQYRCLGQWEENGRMYTYTQRRDVGTYECFVGTIVSDTEIYIKEAGNHCERDVDPLQNGMKLTRQGPCTGSQMTTVKPTRPHTSNTRMTTKSHSIPEPTKPWKPITAPPRNVNVGQNSAPTVLRLDFVLMMCHVILIINICT